MIASPQSRWEIAISFSAISRSACSQEIRCHLPSPRSPARLSGTVSRLGPYITSV
ncbi:MAG: hypothetical protein MUF70_13490 [Myxococcota bacterium]|nr:hypothetical protein [Myxococcota bacterium]